MQWLNMHGYAIYVWSAYLVVFIVLAAYLGVVRSYASKVRNILRSWVKV